MSVRPYNFSAGPSAIPLEVLKQTAQDIVDWEGTGVGVAELGHRSPGFKRIAAEAESDLRQLMSIPEDFAVLFLHGGATAQAWAIPHNLGTTEEDTADYVLTGPWGEKAASEAAKSINVHIAAKAEPYSYVPEQKDWEHSDKPAYVHVTPNETIHGVAFSSLPEVKVPLVADMSSTILSEPLDVKKFGVIYGGTQKNMGPAGIGVVIVKRELLGNTRPDTPLIWDWSVQDKEKSMVNTPPTLPLYMSGLVFKWLIEQGGVEAIQQVNAEKARLMYATIDASELFTNPVEPEFRSRMNIPFILKNAGLEVAFERGAIERGLLNFDGHRSVGGFRASPYNATPLEGVQALTDYMKEFEADHA